MTDALGTRMKEYEARETERRFFPYLPVYARIDGRGFSKFTRGMQRPFDPRFTNMMVEVTKHLVAQTHARIGYCQSDEISLVWLQETPEGEIFFDGKPQKMASVLAGMASSKLMHLLVTSEDEDMRARVDRLPHFDARVFQLPNKAEAANVFLWRELDATKNAISMAAHHCFSHKSLQGVSGAKMQERLFTEAGINFNDYPAAFKRGTFVRRETIERAFTDEELAAIPEKHRPPDGSMITRSIMTTLDMPKFSTVTNREGVIFDGDTPKKITLSALLAEHDPVLHPHGELDWGPPIGREII